jgi:hypothetical protein
MQRHDPVCLKMGHAPHYLPFHHLESLKRLKQYHKSPFWGGHWPPECDGIPPQKLESWKIQKYIGYCGIFVESWTIFLHFLLHFYEAIHLPLPQASGVLLLRSNVCSKGAMPAAGLAIRIWPAGLMALGLPNYPGVHSSLTWLTSHLANVALGSLPSLSAKKIEGQDDQRVVWGLGQTSV